MKDKDGNRSFIIARDESTLKEFMDKEDSKGICFKSKTLPLNSFADALVDLERYPWPMMKLLFVHQDFIDPVLSAAKKYRRKNKDFIRQMRSSAFIDELNTKKAVNDEFHSKKSSADKLNFPNNRQTKFRF
ncbi:MAG: hypothetical protein QUS13_08415 [Smithella sp.]|nr:hypothetical protein [Smithella sp.]